MQIAGLIGKVGKEREVLLSADLAAQLRAYRQGAEHHQPVFKGHHSTHETKRQADYTLSVLARILAWSVDRGLVSVNPCEKRGRLYQGGARVDKICSLEDETRFIASAPERLHLPLLLALWIGQRQGDLLRLPWSAYDGTTIRLRQRKTGVRVLIPCGAPLKAALDAAARGKQGPLILVSSTGRPWDPGRLQVGLAPRGRAA